MVCPYHLRLLDEFESASLACEHMRNSILIGNHSEFTTPQRRQLLVDRQRAINTLYEHSVKCEKCRATTHPVKREAKQPEPFEKMRVGKTATRKGRQPSVVAAAKERTTVAGKSRPSVATPSLIQPVVRA